MDHLNYFQPYDAQDPTHENSLTRAYLALLRLVPLALADFLDLVRDAQLSLSPDCAIPARHDLFSQPVSIQTQTTRIFQSTGMLVSILITDEEWPTDQDVRWSERQAVYDGLICFDPDWIFIIENKPSASNVWPDQLNPARSSVDEEGIDNSDGIRLYSRPIVLKWREMLFRLNKLRTSKTRLLHTSEENLISDFIDYVHANFPGLRPYTSLEICANDLASLTKRCVAIMRELDPDGVVWHRANGHCIAVSNGLLREIYLWPMDDNGKLVISLDAWPGDTVNQARGLYNLPQKTLIALNALSSKGWLIKPNLHFAHIQKHLVWAETTATADDYISFWQKNRDGIKQWKRDDSKNFDELFDWLQQNNMVTQQDRIRLDDNFTKTIRQTVNVCPGLHLCFRLPLDEAVALDAGGKLIDEIRSRIDEVLDALS